MKNEIPRTKDETGRAPGGAFRRAFVSFFEFRPSFFIRGFEFRSSNLAACIACICSSGAGGSRLHRRHFGEDMENIAAASEHHWMAGNFIKYASILTPNDLPVDSHELIALCAPRPVFLGSGATKGDGWADATGTFLAGVGAGPVYELLGKRGLGTSGMPVMDTPLLDGELAFRQHSGGHTDLPNWPTFLSFAARYMPRIR